MSDERIRLPWEHEGNGEDLPDDKSHLREDVEGTPRSINEATSDGDAVHDADRSVSSIRKGDRPFAIQSSSPVASGWLVADAGDADDGEISISDSIPAETAGGKSFKDGVDVEWSTGALPDRRSQGVNLGRSSILRSLRGVASRLRTRDALENDDVVWLDDTPESRPIDSWIAELSSTYGENSEQFFVNHSSEPEIELVDEVSTERDLAGALLEGPRGEVKVPGFSIARYVTFAGIVTLLALGVTLYGFVVPTLRGNGYRNDLRNSFESTGELRNELRTILSPGQLPDEPGMAGTRYRTLADSYAPYSKAVNATPPRRPLFAFTESFERAMSARQALLALNDYLGPATEQVRMRGNYLDVIAAAQDQMSRARAVLTPEDPHGAESELIVEGAIANAASLRGVVATQKPPAGYEDLNRALLSKLSLFSETGKRYMLAIKTEDDLLALQLRGELYSLVEGFDAVMATPVSAGLSDDDFGAIDRLSAEAEHALL